MLKQIIRSLLQYVSIIDCHEIVTQHVCHILVIGMSNVERPHNKNRSTALLEEHDVEVWWYFFFLYGLLGLCSISTSDKLPITSSSTLTNRLPFLLFKSDDNKIAANFVTNCVISSYKIWCIIIFNTYH